MGEGRHGGSPAFVQSVPMTAFLRVQCPELCQSSGRGIRAGAGTTTAGLTNLWLPY